MSRLATQKNMGILFALIFFILSITVCINSLSEEIAYAESSNIPIVTVENRTVHRGQTFAVDVNISGNEGLISLFLTLDYDSTVMTLKNVIQGEALQLLTFTTKNVDTDDGYGILPFNMLWDGREQDKTNGRIITLIFDTFITAPLGNYPVKFTFDKQNTNVNYQTPTDISIIDGVITLISGEYQAIYKDFDGTVLFEKDYNSEDIPEYPATLPLPARAEDEKYRYDFIGWEGVPSDDVKTLIFEASYEEIPQIYVVFYYIDGCNGDPDGIVDDDDFFAAEEVGYGTFIKYPDVPQRQHYKFFGWYSDRDFTTTALQSTMPAKDVRLYGYYSFDIRENEIPIISLENVVVDDSNDVIVTATILKNTGFNGLLLTLKYDKDAFVFKRFERKDILSSMQFDSTGTDSSNDSDFKFYYESAENNYETGEFLILYFEQKSEAADGVYEITFDYDYHSDATYVDYEKT